MLQETWLHRPLCWGSTKSHIATACAWAAAAALPGAGLQHGCTISQLWLHACLRGVARGGQLLLQGCIKLPLLSIHPLPYGRQTEQKRALAFSSTGGHVWATSEVGSYYTASLCDHKQQGVAGGKGERQRVASPCPGSQPVVRGEGNAVRSTEALEHMSQSPSSSHSLCSARVMERVALWPQVSTRWCLQRHCR